MKARLEFPKMILNFFKVRVGYEQFIKSMAFKNLFVEKDVRGNKKSSFCCIS